MKIILTGGGTGGHFYPVIAVAQAINKLVREQRLLEVELYYLAPVPYDASAIFENNIIFKKVSAGKMRRYFSPLNIIDIIKTFFGILGAIRTVFNIYPDVIFSKGGYVSFPVTVAAKILRIPLIIHESDSAPGKANKWAGKFAQKIAVSYPEAAQYFPEGKVAYTGNPVRSELEIPIRDGAHDALELNPAVPTVLVLGGSQGAILVNDLVLDALPILVQKYQVIHQVGKNNIKIVKETASVVLQNNEHKDRYRPYDHLNTLNMRMAAGVANIVVSRAGSTIFEIAAWGIPSIIIPITDSNGDHQRKNAFNYARTKACMVIQENNLTPHVLISEIERIMNNPEKMQEMKTAAKNFARVNAAELIAGEILSIALQHEV